MKLAGKNVLVTGGTKGIGKAVVEAMAQEGANVIINYAHDEKLTSEAATNIEKHGVKTLLVKADVGNQAEIDTMFKKIASTFKTLDVLVNNAAGFDSSDNPSNIESFEKVFNTSLFGQVRVTNAACKLMEKGKIIYLSSIHGKLGHGRPNITAYSSAKAALESYMKNLAKGLAPDILVNAVAPGRTLTPQWGEMTEEFKKEQAAGQLINRWIDPSEIADGVVFLAKNDAVCGEVLVIDGGMSLKVLG